MFGYKPVLWNRVRNDRHVNYFRISEFLYRFVLFHHFVLYVHVVHRYNIERDRIYRTADELFVKNSAKMRKRINHVTHPQIIIFVLIAMCTHEFIKYAVPVPVFTCTWLHLLLSVRKLCIPESTLNCHKFCTFVWITPLVSQLVLHSHVKRVFFHSSSCVY